jgi:hypothetical protein
MAELDFDDTVHRTSSTKILINGQPGRRICHARGLHQGDPLSPMLFVLVMEVLNHCLHWLAQQGFLAVIPASMAIA